MSVIRADNDDSKKQVGNVGRFRVVRRRNCVRSSSPLAGFSGQLEQHGPESDSANARPLSQQWLSDERIAETRRVWSKAYGRVISQDEAIEILTNVRRLAEVLFKAEEDLES